MQCREIYMRHPLLETGWEYAAHLHLKRYTPKQLFFRHTPKITFSSCYNKWSVGYFGLKLHRHILGTPKTNITFCKKGHNRCPLKEFINFFFTSPIYDLCPPLSVLVLFRTVRSVWCSCMCFLWLQNYKPQLIVFSLPRIRCTLC